MSVRLFVEGAKLACAVLLTCAAAACSSLPRHPVPESLADAAKIPGIPNARFWGDAMTPGFEEWLRAGYRREREYLRSQGISTLPNVSFLALSGGGENGAYSAGLLCGWGARGDRPVFRVVTGVSTGALIAPFAFVGSDYDGVLRELYTTFSTRDLVKSRGVLDGLLSDAMFDTAPLRRILEKHVNAEFLARVAAEFAKGRGLVICTTNMDSQRPVVWTMGPIAASGHPDSVRLFVDVMIASAAIPGAFPPVLFKVEAGGKIYDELHADGGTASQVFLYPASFNLKEFSKQAGVERGRSVYVIRNARVTPEFESMERSTLKLAQRAVSTLIKMQGVGDLYRIYLGCLRDGIDFNLAYVPAEFREESKEAFDPEYMKKLFELGYENAKGGYPWLKAPPGFEPPAVDERAGIQEKTGTGAPS